ncbi:DUF1446 domain-containing protein [Solimonas sp. K1W22B-7]|uniref:acyclic terpene utilization AtuA family protein n=1 Tax=Solimonas sp. K1W22B-7 TaxID=2303331 RepID=UPI000E32EEE9|nr:acyclic terpene utilization AtuA family protein [Solimonas sp. K1W22B-7]AXQ30596.1 DUF1446 domain-containing protein [Solimonas sp. K1W22B-7]
MSAKRPVRIANCSGFYGDRLAAAREMVEGGPIDVLTGDWLAELTMLILAKDRMKEPQGGYAKTFVKQMQQVMATCLEKGIKVVANAGGLNPEGCAAAVRKVADELGLKPKIAWVGGDNLLAELPQLRSEGLDFRNMDTGEPLGERQVLTANAYLGGWGIVDALNRGADIVITGRTTDAAVVAGPAAWYHGWRREDYDAIAGAIVAGHVIECGAQATGGNYAFFKEVPGLEYPGFPIAEIAADGSSVITKHAGHGGLVSVGTVTAQLLYEIGAPAYLNPDAVARFDTMTVVQDGPDRVRIAGVRGEAPPETLKVCMNYVGGTRTVVAMALTGLDLEEKADLYTRSLWRQFPRGRDSFAESRVELIRGNLADPNSNEEHTATLRITVKDQDANLVGAELFRKNVELGLASYPGLYALPGSSQMYGVCWPTLMPAARLTQVVDVDGEVTQVSCAPATTRHAAIEPLRPALPPVPGGDTREEALGRIFGARSGDKAGNANLGVWARNDAAYAWLEQNLTVGKLAELMPEAREYRVERHALANIRSLNFVFKGLLGEGVAASTRLDAQAKSLGEYLRALRMDIPLSLLDA